MTIEEAVLHRFQCVACGRKPKDGGLRLVETTGPASARVECPGCLASWEAHLPMADQGQAVVPQVSQVERR